MNKRRTNPNGDKVILHYLTEYHNLSPEEAEDRMDEGGISLREGDAEEYARDYVEDSGMSPMEMFTNAEQYFDYASIGSDLKTENALESGLLDEKEELEDQISEKGDNLAELKITYEKAQSAHAALTKKSSRYGSVSDAALEASEGSVDESGEALQSEEDEIDELKDEQGEIEDNIEHYASMSDSQYGEEWVSQIGEVTPDQAEQYFDYASVANDMLAGGDVVEFEFEGVGYTAEANI